MGFFLFQNEKSIHRPTSCQQESPQKVYLAIFINSITGLQFQDQITAHLRPQTIRFEKFLLSNCIKHLFLKMVFHNVMLHLCFLLHFWPFVSLIL